MRTPQNFFWDLVIFLTFSSTTPFLIITVACHPLGKFDDNTTIKEIAGSGRVIPVIVPAKVKANATSPGPVLDFPQYLESPLSEFWDQRYQNQCLLQESLEALN